MDRRGARICRRILKSERAQTHAHTHYIPHPIGVLAPLLIPILRRFLEEERQLDVRGGVQVASDLIPRRPQPRLLKQLGLVIPRTTTVLGVIIVVERVVRRLRELAVAQNLLAQGAVQGIQQTPPVVAALNIAPPPGQITGRRRVGDVHAHLPLLALHALDSRTSRRTLLEIISLSGLFPELYLKPKSGDHSLQH